MSTKALLMVGFWLFVIVLALSYYHACLKPVVASHEGDFFPIPRVV